jgi:GNAT superfamily N-acetyltransferase
MAEPAVNQAAAHIRLVAPADRAAWDALWRGYLSFYRADLPPAVTEHTWSALLDDASPVHGLVAEASAGGAARLVGLAHVVLHASTWSTAPSCYLEDLFVAPDYRGTGVAAALIAAVYTVADEQRAGAVYWLTQEYNGAARSLYDTVARRSSFVVYQR